MTAKLSDSYSCPSFFLTSAKRRQRTASHDEGYFPTFSLRYAARSTLKTFNQVLYSWRCLVLVFASQVSKLFFWQRSKSTTNRDNSADAMLCADWPVSITYCIFDWLGQTVLYFLNWTVCLFLKEIPI